MCHAGLGKSQGDHCESFQGGQLQPAHQALPPLAPAPQYLDQHRQEDLPQGDQCTHAPAPQHPSGRQRAPRPRARTAVEGPVAPLQGHRPAQAEPQSHHWQHCHALVRRNDGKQWTAGERGPRPGACPPPGAAARDAVAPRHCVHPQGRAPAQPP